MSTPNPDQFVAVVSAALADPGPDDRELLVSIVDIARAIFSSAASSIFLRSGDGRSLTFEAVSGAGAAELIGTQFPADRGIAGWVAATGEPVIIDDSQSNASFAADFAQSTGYTPTVIMAVPVSYAGEVLGVLEVLDPHGTRPNIDDLDLLTMFAAQAGLALRNLVRHREARLALAGHGAGYAELAAIVGAFERLGGERRDAGFALLGAVHTLLEV